MLNHLINHKPDLVEGIIGSSYAFQNKSTSNIKMQLNTQLNKNISNDLSVVDFSSMQNFYSKEIKYRHVLRTDTENVHLFCLFCFKESKATNSISTFTETQKHFHFAFMVIYSRKAALYLNIVVNTYQVVPR